MNKLQICSRKDNDSWAPHRHFGAPLWLGARLCAYSTGLSFIAFLPCRRPQKLFFMVQFRGFVIGEGDGTVCNWRKSPLAITAIGLCSSSLNSQQPPPNPFTYIELELNFLLSKLVAKGFRSEELQITVIKET